MTAVVALDLANPDEEFTVTEKAAKVIPTKIGVVVGQKMTLRELLHAALLTSANDAVQVIEDGIDAKYGEPVFVRAMNEKAQFLKLTESHFMNPQGFDNAEHYSSAHDLAVLTHYAMQYPLISEIVKKDYEYLPADQNHKQFDLPNWQGLLGVYPGAEGVKIGNTDSALHTTVVLSQREGKTILAVVLGANNGLDRDLKAAELLDYGFGKYNIKPANITTEQLQAKYQTWNAILNKS
jgi:D-alanyl-D-alanine carboxypeptidase